MSLFGAKPFLAERDGGAEHGRVDREQRRERAARVQVDDDVGERLDASALWAIDQDGLAIVDKPPGGGEAQLALIVREEPRA